jgi:hypothetical protein
MELTAARISRRMSSNDSSNDWLPLRYDFEEIKESDRTLVIGLD